MAILLHLSYFSLIGACFAWEQLRPSASIFDGPIQPDWADSLFGNSKSAHLQSDLGPPIWHGLQQAPDFSLSTQGRDPFARPTPYNPLTPASSCQADCSKPKKGRAFRRIEELALQRSTTASPGLEGLATADFNGDGFLDQVLCGHTFAPGPPGEFDIPRLLLGRGDGSFDDATADSGITHRFCFSVVAADLDNDGDADLVMSFGGTASDGCYVMLNDGHGRFAELAGAFETCPGFPGHLAVGDVNNDGFLDVYAPALNNVAPELPNGKSALLLGDGSGRLKHLPNSGADDPKYPCISSFIDLDDDGDADLLALGCNKLDAPLQPIPTPLYMYRNSFSQNGVVKFEDASNDYGLGKRNGLWMSTAFGDYNGDGLLDMYFGNGGCLFVETHGGYADGTTCAEFAHALLRNNGDGTYTDVADRAGIEQARFNWGAAFVDLENDGTHDLVTVGNGLALPPLLEATRAGATPRLYTGGEVFRNWYGERFELVEDHEIMSGVGLSVGDVDGDGLVDVFIQKNGVAHANGTVVESPDAVLLLNMNRDGNVWLKVSLQGTRSNRDAIGSKVRVRWRNRHCSTTHSECRCRWERRVQVLAVVAGSSAMSSHDKVLTFGLGRRGASIDEIEVQWPNGKRQRVDGHRVAVNTLVHIKESQY